MYERSARIYDLLYTATGIKDFDAEARELRALIRQRHPKARTLLDVACGTGQHLARLREHFEVEGVDSSPAMIAVARERLGDVRLWVGDMQRLNLGRRYDVVTCLFSSISYVVGSDDLKETLRRFMEHLHPEGLLILDGWLRPDAWKDDHLSAPDVADDGRTTIVRLTTSSRRGNITTMRMHHLVRTGGDVEYFVEEHALALVPTNEYVAAAEAAGMVVDVIHDYLPGRDRLVATRPG